MVCHEQPSQPPGSRAFLSIIFLSFSFISFPSRSRRIVPSFTIPEIFLSSFPPKGHPSVAPYSKWILCAAARSEGRELYLAEGNTTQGTDSECASWKLLPTSRLNLLWMNAREQIRVKTTIRDGNYDAFQIKALSSIFQLTSKRLFILFCLKLLFQIIFFDIFARKENNKCKCII